jgi:hypothetical protein
MKRFMRMNYPPIIKKMKNSEVATGWTPLTLYCEKNMRVQPSLAKTRNVERKASENVLNVNFWL